MPHGGRRLGYLIGKFYLIDTGLPLKSGLLVPIEVFVII